MATYSWFTISTTAWRTKFRRDANQADNKGATRAVDALINFEAVKVRSSLNRCRRGVPPLTTNICPLIDSTLAMKSMRWRNMTRR